MQGLELQLKALSSITEHPKGAVICQKLALADLFARAGRPAWAVQSVEEAMQQAIEDAKLSFRVILGADEKRVEQYTARSSGQGKGLWQIVVRSRRSRR